MRPIAVLLALAAAACSSPRGGSVSSAAGRPLGPELFPFEERTAQVAVAGSPARTLRVAPTPEGARLWIEDAPMRLDVRRAGDAYVFSAGPDAETEVLRMGAVPGTEWTSGASRVRFDGWERLVLPAGTFDAARVRVTSGPAELPQVETWWFAPGTGLVRLRTEGANLYVGELTLTR